MARKLKEWEAGRIVTYDASVCSGCRTCETVCALAHEGVANPAYARISVKRHPLDVEHCDIHACAQCEGAPCVKACPTDAIAEDPTTHAKVVDAESCIGCGICVRACIMEPTRISIDPVRKVALKCDLCGGSPKCVEICPMGALAYKEVRS